jgi:hypothetical protein
MAMPGEYPEPKIEGHWLTGPKAAGDHFRGANKVPSGFGDRLIRLNSGIEKEAFVEIFEEEYKKQFGVYPIWKQLRENPDLSLSDLGATIEETGETLKQLDGRNFQDPKHKQAVNQWNCFHDSLHTKTSEKWFSGYSGLVTELFEKIRHEIEAHAGTKASPYLAGNIPAFIGYYHLACRWRRSTEGKGGPNYSPKQTVKKFMRFFPVEVISEAYPQIPDVKNPSVPGLSALIPVVLGVMRCDYKDSPEAVTVSVEGLNNLLAWEDKRAGYTFGEMYSIACGEMYAGEQFGEELALALDEQFNEYFNSKLE